MRRRTYELWWALLAIVIITAIYILVTVGLQEIPQSSELFGHTLGVVGFIFMLMTETLYSIRKRSRRAQWGKMSTWLQFHIFTGLAGPYMVLLHTAWKFNGLAGAVTLLTIIIVVSGFIGRYIFTAIPRDIDGAALTVNELESGIASTEAQLQTWLAQQPDLEKSIPNNLLRTPQKVDSLWRVVLGRLFYNWRYRYQWWRFKQQLDSTMRNQATELERMMRRRRSLHRQVASLAMVRQTLGLWHAIHVPIGMALFSSAIIHIGAALYFATFLH